MARTLLYSLALISTVSPLSAKPDVLAVTDKLGRRVTVAVPVQRAILLEGYELLPVLGTWDRVAGLSRYAFENDLMRAARPDLARAFPSVGGNAMDVNAEALLKLKPDLVVIWALKPETIHFLENRGLTVIAIHPESLDELCETLLLIGRVFGAEPKAAAAVTRMREVFRLVRQRTAPISAEQRKKALWLMGKPTAINGGLGLAQDVLTLAGMENSAVALAQRYAEVSLEQILLWRPEALFIWGSARYGPEEILDSPQWRTVPAVRDRRVYQVPKWSTWSPRLAPIALWMAAKAYPERFVDVDVEQATDRFFRDTYGFAYAKVRRFEN